MSTCPEYEEFLQTWGDESEEAKFVAESIYAHLRGMPNIVFNYVPRPGISYSLRAAHPSQTQRSLFVLVDVVDDDPDDRWLSICFYDAFVTDPEERGDQVPNGLLGEDARCFDVAEDDAELIHYLLERFNEAWKNAEEK